MTTLSSNSYTHRLKQDGSHDSICLACLATIASQKDESALAREEEDHVCKFQFHARRTSPEDQANPRMKRWSHRA